MTWIDTKLQNHTYWQHDEIGLKKKLEICKIEDYYDNEKLFLELVRQACDKKICIN